MQDEERVEKDILRILYRQYKQRVDYTEGPLEDMLRWRISYYDLVTIIKKYDEALGRNESVLHRAIDGMKEQGLLTTEGGYWVKLKQPGIEKIRIAIEESMPF
jgi:hypothetical protein